MQLASRALQASQQGHVARWWVVDPVPDDSARSVWKGAIVPMFQVVHVAEGCGRVGVQPAGQHMVPPAVTMMMIPAAATDMKSLLQTGGAAR